MASTFTSRLRLEKITSGEQSGSWGTTTNTQYDLFDVAVAGYLAIAMGDANVTLTTNNGSSDQARYAVLKLTGTNSTTRDVIAPAVSKVYIIANATTQSIRIKTSSGAAVTIPTGETYTVFCDGTDFGQVGLSSSLALLKANNLSDLADAPTARTNLGLGTAAVVNTGTSGATLGLLNVANTWGASQIYAQGFGPSFANSGATHGIFNYNNTTFIITHNTADWETSLRLATDLVEIYANGNALSWDGTTLTATLTRSGTWTGGTYASPTLSGTVAGAPGWASAQTFPTGTIVGSGSGTAALSVDAGGSGSGVGPLVNFKAGGSSIGAIGGYSGIVGGAYNADLTLYGASGLVYIYDGAKRVIATRDATETFTNKTLASPTLSGTVAGTPAFSGQVSFTYGNTIFQGADISLDFKETGVSADAGNWRLSANAEAFALYAVNDAFSAYNPVLNITRSGATVGTIALSGTAFTFGGNTVLTTANGAALSGATFTGAITLQLASSSRVNFRAAAGGSTGYIAGRAIGSDDADNFFLYSEAAGEVFRHTASSNLFAFTSSIQAPIAVSSETSGSLTSASRNKQVHCSGGVTLPSSGMTDGDIILIDPRGTARTITRPGSHTMYVNDADSATATTAAHNIVTAKYHGSSKWTLQGAVS